MFPLGHAAFAYLGYVGLAAVTRRHLPVHWGLLPLAVGSQLPDLLDKPLSYAGVLVSGRSLGHSVVTAVMLVLLVWWTVRRLSAPGSAWQRRILAVSPTAFAVGYVSHLLADAIEPLVTGAYGELRFLLWPVVPPIDYPTGDLSPVARVVAMYRAPGTHPQIELILLAAGVFLALELRSRIGSRPTEG